MCPGRPAVFPAETTNTLPTARACASLTTRGRQKAPPASQFRPPWAQAATPKPRPAPKGHTVCATPPTARPATVRTGAAPTRTAMAGTSVTKTAPTASAVGRPWATATLASRRTTAPKVRRPTARRCSRSCASCLARPAIRTCASKAKFAATSSFSSRFVCLATPAPKRAGHRFNEASAPFAWPRGPGWHSARS